MLQIANIRNVRKGQYDQVWAIVRSYKGQSDWIKQVPVLSPSWDLFGKYRDLKSDNNWNDQTFRSVYLPQFLSEMRSDEARQALNVLYRLDKAGQNIALVCFCPDETMCHRSIIAGLLQGVGCDVHTELGADYSDYYKLWKDAQKPAPTEQQAPSFRGDKYYLSNMYACPVTMEIDGKTCKFGCAEAAYQAHRFPGRAHEFEPLNGYEAKKKAQTGGRSDWHQVNVSVMRSVLAAKFGQNPDLMARLKAEPGELVEINTWGDRFWGVCGGKGENTLGKLLMELRDTP